MLDEKKTGLPLEKCVDLLLEQCDAFLKEPPPSKKIIKPLVPLFAFIGVVATTLLSAYLYAGSLISEFKACTTIVEWLNIIMSDLAPEIVGNPNLFNLFLVLCLCVVIVYLAIIFACTTIIVPLLDRKKQLAEELRSVLQYIKKCQTK